MNSTSQWGEMPRSVDHGDHAVIEPVRKLAERGMTSGSAMDIEKMIAKAEQNLATLKQEFPVWMASEFTELQKAWADYKADVPDAKRLLFRRVHDMRGQAATFGFPLAGRAADNLCKLMDTVEAVPVDIIEAHVQTINVIIRENINIEDHPVGIMMIMELEKLGHAMIRNALLNKKD